MQNPIHVLLADDNPHIRQAICQVIQQASDIQVVGEAGNGLQTIELIQQLKPDIAIVDISMPEMDGIDVAEELYLSHDPTHILILTGYASNEFAQLAQELNVDGYLLKEEAANCLVDVIYRIMTGERGIFSQKVLSYADGVQQVKQPPCEV
jgi:two-component system response regulator DesR